MKHRFNRALIAVLLVGAASAASAATHSHKARVAIPEAMAAHADDLQATTAPQMSELDRLLYERSVEFNK